jgi:CubicO group peptidase (beta-lactamase class C family)
VARWLAKAVLAGSLVALLSACGGDSQDSSPGAVVSTREPGETPTPTAAEFTPTPEATATETPTTAAPADATPGSVLSCAERSTELERLTTGIDSAMTDYDGEWGFALLDLDCGLRAEINAEYYQYPASSSKIVSVIAVMRAVERGDVELDEFRANLELVMHVSFDGDADVLDSYLEQEDFDEVLQLAGTSEGAYVREQTWRRTWMTATDMALVWAALVKGELLGPENTAYILRLASEADIPDDQETFPDRAFELPGYEYGQKAGYYISDGVPYDFVGAGYLVPRSGEGDGFVAVVFIHSEVEPLLDPQRRTIFPLVVDYVTTVAPRQ